jgi:hypothetical protein
MTWHYIYLNVVFSILETRYRYIRSRTLTCMGESTRMTTYEHLSETESAELEGEEVV